MNLIKCPRCDLNYIREDEKYCKVCLRELKGERQGDEPELCSICNEEPALPGKDVCLICYKEMTQQQGLRDETADEVENPDVSLDMEDVSDMQEIELDEMDSDMPPDIGEQISLEEEKSKEDMDDEEEEEI